MLKDNPFFIFNIPMTASKETVMTAADIQSLRSDSRIYDQMAYQLINPVKRLEAELDWFPQEDEETVSIISEAVRNGKPVPFETVSELSDLGKINAAIHELSLSDPDSWNDSSEDFTGKIEAIGINLGRYLTHDLLSAINDKRSMAEIAAAAFSALEAEDIAKKSRVADSLSELIGSMTRENQLIFMNALADRYSPAESYDAADADTAAVSLYCALTDRFETRTIREYNALSEELKTIISKIIAHGGLSKAVFLKRKYNRKLTEWLRYDRPMHVASALRGTARNESIDMLKRSLEMLAGRTSGDGLFSYYEFLDSLKKRFKDLPGAGRVITKHVEWLEHHFVSLTGRSFEEETRIRRRDRGRSIFVAVFLLIVFLFVGIQIMIAPSETELADDPSSQYYREIRLPYKLDIHGEYEQVKMPPTGFVFQDTMGDEDRSVTLTIKGLDASNSFVRISDRNYGNETYIYLPGEEMEFSDKLEWEVSRDVLQQMFEDGKLPELRESLEKENNNVVSGQGNEQASEDARIFSVMVRKGEKVQVALPPGEYCLSYDHGTLWYGWRLRFTSQLLSVPNSPLEVKMPEMKLLTDELRLLEKGKNYVVELEP